MINRRLLAALAAMVVLASVPFVAAQPYRHMFQFEESLGVVSITTGEIGVRVTADGEVPHFHWWNETDPGTDYHIMFNRLFEANDSNEDMIFDPGVDAIVGGAFSLPKADWDFSGFLTEEQNDVVTALHFNFTTTETYDHGSGMVTMPGMHRIPGHTNPMDVEIQIRIHFYLATPDQFKFDLRISGWEWTNTDSILVFQFTVGESEHNRNISERDVSRVDQEGTKFSFGNAWMEYAQHAFAGNASHQVEVRASHGEGLMAQEHKSLFIAFEYFGDETLDYDPILGISPLSTTWTFLGIDYNQLVLLAGGFSVLAIIVIAVRYRNS
ncbi:MAG: hypothetical protein AM325_014120 [Candidatus Thorarchaeota archaeon SMTZ1-45]